MNIPISSLLCREVVKNQVYYPAIGQKGSSTKNGVNSAGFKVFNNHGIKNTTYYQYPYATSSNQGINGNNLGGLDLNMSGDTGLYNTLHKKFYDYISARKSIEGFFDIEEHTLHDLINIYKARNEVWKVRVGSQNYLPEVLDVSIGLDAIKSCKITLR